jgi:hypothetical protein
VIWPHAVLPSFFFVLPPPLLAPPPNLGLPHVRSLSRDLVTCRRGARRANDGRRARARETSMGTPPPSARRPLLLSSALPCLFSRFLDRGAVSIRHAARMLPSRASTVQSCVAFCCRRVLQLFRSRSESWTCIALVERQSDHRLVAVEKIPYLTLS